MSDQHPDPPETVPESVVETIRSADRATVQAIAAYASAVADADTEEVDTETDSDDPSGTEDHEAADRPGDVPTKATLTVKTINDNRYYYWQWREGDEIKSSYHGPVDPDG